MAFGRPLRATDSQAILGVAGKEKTRSGLSGLKRVLGDGRCSLFEGRREARKGALTHGLVPSSDGVFVIDPTAVRIYGLRVVKLVIFPAMEQGTVEGTRGVEPLKNNVTRRVQVEGRRTGGARDVNGFVGFAIVES